MINISLVELEKVFGMIVDKLKADKVESTSINMDEYWTVLPSEWNVFSKEPSLAVGSLEDDMKFIKQSIVADMIVSYSDFDRISSVLKYISEKQAPSYRDLNDFS